MKLRNPKEISFPCKNAEKFFSSDFPRRILAQSISVLIAQKNKKETRIAREREM